MRTVKFASKLLICLLFLAFTNPDKDSTYYTINSLFKIERSKDNNQILYDVNLDKSGHINRKNPINIYWIRNTEGGKIKPLTWIQQKFAYGLHFINVNKEYANFKFVSYNKMMFTLKRIKNNQFEVYTKHNNKLLKINRIFIQINGGSFWVPNITAVEIYARNMKTGKNVIETITP